VKERLKAAWEWVKANWAWALLAPVAFIPWLIFLLMRKSEVVVLDPLKNADARAETGRAERETLEDVAETERRQLEAELEKKIADRTGTLEAQQAAEVEPLRNDLDEVARRMRR
jgi:flagellar biosynthesis/type III secretory pathway M-ring protein FliF/YscJ